MCGARFAVHSGLAPRQCRFSTMSGVVTAEVAADRADPRVAIALVDSSPLVRDVPVQLDGVMRNFDAVTVGVPHVVTVVDDADGGDLAGVDAFHSYGRAVRRHEAFAPAGTNVNVIHRVDKRTIRMRTYERGVEAETLACGTGAAASAFVAVARGLVSQPVSVLTSSGRPIEVTLQVHPDADGERARSIRIAGEARFVAHGVLEPEGWD
jgi:diaminopimelate epimerase